MTSITLNSLLAALAMAAATSPAQAQPSTPITSADAAMRQQLRLEEGRRGSLTWAERRASMATPSADQHLQQIVAGYHRERLDRGGWRSPWMSGDGYAAGEPLLAAKPGNGVTTPGAPVTSAPTVLAGH